MISVSLQYMQHTAQEEAVTLPALHLPFCLSKERKHRLQPVHFWNYFLLLFDPLTVKQEGWNAMKIQGQIQGHCLTRCISSLDTMLSSHHQSIHPRTHTEGEKKKKNCLIKLPQHASHHSYSINTTAMYNTETCSSVKLLDWMRAHQLGY